MLDADKKIPAWTEEQLQTWDSVDGESPFERKLHGDVYDASRPWRAFLTGAIIGLIGVLVFIVMSACVPL